MINTFDEITIDNIEHTFPSEISINVQILSWITLILINTSNGYVIYIITKQLKTALDWLFLMDSILCIFNSIPVIRLGIVGHSVYVNLSYNSILCTFFTFYSYFVNLLSRLITIVISVYRYIFVVKYDIVQDPVKRQIIIRSLFSAMFYIAVFQTGYGIYYKNSYKLYLCMYVLFVLRMVGL